MAKELPSTDHVVLWCFAGCIIGFLAAKIGHDAYYIDHKPNYRPQGLMWLYNVRQVFALFAYPYATAGSVAGALWGCRIRNPYVWPIVVVGGLGFLAGEVVPPDHVGRDANERLLGPALGGLVGTLLGVYIADVWRRT
jgi:hypothetical protein